ncbi:MAG: inorganic phosphate transporter [Burkholderiaceae bacterium]|nr:inorganic phosphate transporter [Burkholderiaceae bacterium]
MTRRQNSDLEKMLLLEQAARPAQREMLRLGLALLFVVGIILYITMRGGQFSYALLVAAIIGGYMAMNIGANDVANNVGPAVGSKTLSMAGAIAIAAIFEAAGALIAGGDVVGTIKSGIINPAAIADPNVFVWLMIGALLAGAVWLNIATFIGAPVSTTHSIVGGVLGAGVAAGGWGVANWGTMAGISASWVISPVLGGGIAALFLYVIKRTVTYKADMREAAVRVVPWLLAFMAWSFTTYLCLKGLNKLVKISFFGAALVGLVVAALIFLSTRPMVARVALQAENSKQTVNRLFNVPLVFAAALLSFAHGANDVANAVGPLAAINQVVEQGVIAGKAGIPVWVMVIGAVGISLGLALYGPKLIKTVGSEITELDQLRAFCIAMSAAITVIVASQLGLPVSSTHIAIGAVFGVGFLREYIKSHYGQMIATIEDHHRGADHAEVEAYLERFDAASIEEKGQMLAELKASRESMNPTQPPGLTKSERKGLKSMYRQELVKRSSFKRIIAAWLITVPISGLLGAMFFFTIRGMMLP